MSVLYEPQDDDKIYSNELGKALVKIDDLERKLSRADHLEEEIDAKRRNGVVAMHLGASSFIFICLMMSIAEAHGLAMALLVLSANVFSLGAYLAFATPKKKKKNDDV